MGFAMDGSSYFVVTHGGHLEFKTANMSLYRLQLNLSLTLVIASFKIDYFFDTLKYF